MNPPKTANGSITPTPRRAAESRTARRSSRPTPKTSPASTISPGGHPKTRTRARGSSPLRGSSPHARVSKLPAPGQLSEADTQQRVGNYLATSGDSCWPLTIDVVDAGAVGGLDLLEAAWGLRLLLPEQSPTLRGRLRAKASTATPVPAASMPCRAGLPCPRPANSSYGTGHALIEPEAPSPR